VLATGPGYPAVVCVWTTTTVRFGSRTIQTPDALPFGRSNPNPYSSTCGICRVGQDMSVPISGSVFRVFPFLLAFSYSSANRTLLTLICHCPFRMNRLPLSQKTRDSGSLPHPEHDSRGHVKDFCTCIMGNLGGNWMQKIINAVLAMFQRKK